MPNIYINAPPLTALQKQEIVEGLFSAVGRELKADENRITVVFRPIQPEDLYVGRIVQERGARSNRDIFVNIQLLEGRSEEQKKGAVQVIREVLSLHTGVSREKIRVLFFDLVPGENVIL